MKWFYSCLLASMLILGCSSLAEAFEHETSNLILLLVPSLSFDEVEWLLEHGQHSDMWETGHLAAMNIRSDGPYSYLNSTVTLSLGARGEGVSDWNAFERGELVLGQPVEAIMQQWLSQKQESQLYHPYLPQLVKKNAQGHLVGRLGTLLKQHDVTMNVFGHSDTATEPHRYGSLFVMDGQGRATGDLQGTVRALMSAPHGMAMNEEALLSKLRDQTDSKAFTVIEWGDLYRLFDQKKNMPSAIFAEKRAKELYRLETFIHNVTTGSASDVWLLAPIMHDEAYKQKKRLAPTYFWGSGFKGSPYSASTRRSDVLANVDVAPTILSYFHISPDPQMTGRPLLFQVDSVENDKEAIVSEVNKLFTIFRTRGAVLSSYITMLVVMLLVASIGSWVKKGNPRWRLGMKMILASAVSTPLWLLVLTPFVHEVGPYLFVLTVIGCSLILGWTATQLSAQPIWLLGFLLVAAISIDLMNGGPFIATSYLGYDPIIGARYYGIGNEFAGLYIAAAVLLITGAVWQTELWKRLVTVFVVSGFTLMMLGMSQFGANAGATLSAGIACAFVGYTLIGKQLSKWNLVIVSGGALLITLLLLFVLQMNSPSTHIGDAYERLLSGDIQYVLQTMKRKVAMNMTIFRYSNWTQLFVTSYLLLGVLIWTQSAKKYDAGQSLFLKGGIVASVALLLLNDSGVVAAATSMFFIVSTNYYWLLAQMQNGKMMSEGKEM
ncbi:hypothetical protein P4637_17960 [Halalkalibacterium halodurans]|uniref:hypothetical protein n=1 Tax=Halalkalibacterium halodurans TaxID=86665 RepID=UPI002E1F8E89|nr:hypothetical protein [Halalkalibacterium halodurans]MED4086699.1 hypothetical protein [Halalkalibacterium halodurans]MED4103753.1 hypothetical protein [Halalkalibacterium halodurans]MED4110221.1 hypothetical protein [Halalkalibacterium halodurans]MED4147504.1 hypothetical protein [Halalkalibacterium halodurans]